MSETWDNEFEVWRKDQLGLQIVDKDFAKLSQDWMQASVNSKYSYQFDWLGIPIIQMPGDLIVFQDIVFKTRPDLIIETGVARGGSINFWASILDLCQIEGSVIGIDIDIRSHTREALAQSKFNKSITLLEGSCLSSEIIDQVKSIASFHKNIMVVLDSNHTHEHVLEELNIYAQLVSSNCFLLVLDTVIDDLQSYPERNWGPGRSPKSAVEEFMHENPNMFINSLTHEARAGLTVAPHGYWIRN
jgi:cephalosporin hydroxylase